MNKYRTLYAIQLIKYEDNRWFALREKLGLRLPMTMTKSVAFITFMCTASFVLGRNFVYEVSGGSLSGDLKCNTTATISCQFGSNSQVITWKIAPQIQASTAIAAECYSSSFCNINPTYSASYGFTFDPNTGFANITIQKVTFEHANLQFRCDNNSKIDLFKPNVTVEPEESSVIVSTETYEGDLFLSVETLCVYPKNIKVTWFSETIDGNDRKEEKDVYKSVTLCPMSSDCMVVAANDCIVANKSAKIKSVLKKVMATAGNRRRFEVLIQHVSGMFYVNVGHFSVIDEKPRPSTGLKLSIIILYLVTPVVVSVYLCLEN